MSATRMPWGKYQGRLLAEIPLSYLTWLIEECDLQPALRSAICAALRDRLLPLVGAGADQTPAGPELLARWFRPLAARWHPDKGGTHEAMQAINEARDELARLLNGREK